MHRLVALLLLVAPAAAAAQGRLVVADDAGLYGTLERLQRRGHLLALNPTVAPHSEAEWRAALATTDTAALSRVERGWWRRLARAMPPLTDGLDARLVLAGGGTVTNNERLDPLRWTDAETAVVSAGAANVYPFTSLQASLAHGPWAAQLGARVDVFYEDDPDGLDVVNRSIFLRNQEGYAGATSRWIAAYLGGVTRHWGLPSGEGLVLSDNPRTMDGLALRLGGERIAMRSVVLDLDPATPDGRFTGRAPDVPRETLLRRTLVAHRLDWRPAPWLTLTGLESMLSSGPGAGPSLASLLPTSVISFLNDTPPLYASNNGFVGGMLWAQRGPVTLSGQLLLDDFDLFNSVEPTSAAGTGTLVVAGLAGGQADATLDATVVTARAYNTGLSEQQYVFALRGIGTQFSDFVHVRAGVDVYLDAWVPGLVLRPEGQVLWQGEADLREPYLSNEPPTLLVGTVERTWRAALRAEWAPSPWWWLRADVGVNRTRNDGWQAGRHATRFVGQLDVGGRWRLGTTVR